jgi:hypothetical protein
MIPWEQIKNHWRNEFHQTEIYTDEKEHIIVFKSNDTFTILGYLHYNDCFWMSAREHNDFIDFIKKLGDKSYNPFKIYLLCNCNLSKIKKSNEILSLPNDVDYYYVYYNRFYETIEFKLENQIQSAKHSYNWEQINIPWYHKLGIPVISDSRFEDWGKWSRKGYKREWYDWHENERFEAYWGPAIGYINNFSEVYIDERLLGFYLVWEYEKD